MWRSTRRAPSTRRSVKLGSCVCCKRASSCLTTRPSWWKSSRTTGVRRPAPSTERSTWTGASLSARSFKSTRNRSDQFDWCRLLQGIALLAILPRLASSCFAQSAPTEAPPTASPPQRPAYNLDRSEEDWQFLQDSSQREDLWDPLKYIPLAREGWYLTLAGESRPFYEVYHNYNWGAGPQDGNGYYLQRIMGSTDLHLGDRTL